MREVHRLAKQAMEDAQDTWKEDYDDKYKRRPNAFKVGDKVLVFFPRAVFQTVKNKKFVRQWIPHTVERVISETTYGVKKIDKPRATLSVVHINRMKPFFLPQPAPSEEDTADARPAGEADEAGDKYNL
jgi:hypothetical protein